VFIFDASAISALIDDHPYVKRKWELANSGDAYVLFPVGAMLDVGHARGIAPSAWMPLLQPNMVEVHDLTETIAVEIGGQEGPLGVRHCLWEAHPLGWPIVTGVPWLYPDGTPLLTF
jgi:hypothetical protein